MLLVVAGVELQVTDGFKLHIIEGVELQIVDGLNCILQVVMHRSSWVVPSC